MKVNQIEVTTKMNRLFLRITLPIILLAVLAPGIRAQTEQQDERPEFKMPCEQVLKLGLNKFMDEYGKRTQDYSNFGMKAAFSYWVDCKRPANDALAAKRLSEERRKQVEAAREELNKLGNALWSLRYFEAGGGTMWSVASVGAYAERESYMESFIKALAMPERRSTRARRVANNHLAKIERLLSNPARQPFTDGVEASEVAEQKKLYQETVKETREAVAQLKGIISAMPDAAAAHFAAQMATEATNALDDSP
jgi:hypothetical protein